jgi:hypothetical protein
LTSEFGIHVRLSGRKVAGGGDNSQLALVLRCQRKSSVFYIERIAVLSAILSNDDAVRIAGNHALMSIDLPATRDTLSRGRLSPCFN